MTEHRATELTWPRTAYVVSHTHWDREWYLPFGRFRVSLVAVVRQVLELLERDPEFRHFLLDGQSIVVEDYLAVHPEDRERIARLVRSGALAVGPWYVLPDEFLVSGEATVRNLLLGHRVAGAVGVPQKVGYLPDTFGHIAQMPQILKRAGMDTFVYTRGNGDELDDLGWEFLWEAPDGSTVLAVNQGDGYCAAAALGLEEMWHAHTPRTVDPQRAVSQVGRLFERMRPLARTPVCLVSNGCDHHPPQRDLAGVLGALRTAFPDTEFIHGSLAAYLEALAPHGGSLRRFRGEMLSGKRHLILPGVWSARMYLKQANEAAQSLLTRVLEPLAIYTRTVAGGSYPAGMLRMAWRRLLQNHPHDSICGCSVDEVHREMECRFGEVLQGADQLMRDQLQALVPTFGRTAAGDATTVLGLFNPLPRKRTTVIERLVVLQPPAGAPGEWELVDQAGDSVPFALVNQAWVERFWGIDYRTEWSGERQREEFRRYTGEFPGRMLRPDAERDSRDCFLQLHILAADLPAVGHVTYTLRRVSAGRPRLPAPGSVVATTDFLENDDVRVRLHPDGTVDLIDKRSGREWLALNRLLDEADVGDEYDHAPVEAPGRHTTDGLAGKVRLLEVSPLLARLQWEACWLLPAAIEHDRKARSGSMVATALRLQVTLRHGSPLVEIDLELANSSKDHRLRAAFPTGVVSATVVSDGHFMVNRRPLRPDADPHPDWIQPPAGTWPQQDYSLVQDSTGGLAILNHGLPEIEATADEQGRVTLWLTLLRAVGWLSRDDFAARKYANAGPTVATPEAQCLGSQRMRYALLPFAGDALAAGVAAESTACHAPVIAVQGVADGHVPGGRDGLVEVRTHTTEVAAIKRHEERDTLVVRCYNLAAAPTVETLTLGLPVREAWRLDLLEERLAIVPLVNDRELRLQLGPHEIATLEFDLVPSGRTPATG